MPTLVCIVGDWQRVNEEDLREFQRELALRGARNLLVNDIEEFRQHCANPAFTVHLLGLLTEAVFTTQPLLAKLVREAKRYKLVTTIFIALNPERKTDFLQHLCSNAIVRAGIKLEIGLISECTHLQTLSLQHCFPFPLTKFTPQQDLGTYAFSPRNRCLLHAIQHLYCQLSASSAVGMLVNKHLPGDLCLQHEGDLPVLFKLLIEETFTDLPVIRLIGWRHCRQQNELKRLVAASPIILLEDDASSCVDEPEKEEEAWGEMTYTNLLRKVKIALRDGKYFDLLQHAHLQDEAVAQLLVLAKRALHHNPNELLGQIIGRMGATTTPHHELVVDARQMLKDLFAIEAGAPQSFPLDHFSGLQPVGAMWKQRFPHSFPVYACAFLSNSKIVTACWDGNLRVFDTSRFGEVDLVVACSSAALLCLETCGNLLVVGCADGSIVLLRGFKIERVFEGHVKQITSLLFINNSIISGSHDCTIKVWDLHTGVCMQTLQQRDAISSLVYSSGNLFAGSCDFTVSMYSTTTTSDTELLQLGNMFATGHSGDITSLAVYDDKVLLTGGMDGMVRMFFLSNGEFLQQIDCNDQAVQRLVVVEADHSRLLYVATDRVRVYDLRTISLVAVLPDSPFVISHLCLNDQGMLLVVSQNTTVDLFNVSELATFTTVPHQQQQMITSVSLSSEFAVTTSLDNNLTVWELATGKRTAVLQGHTDVVCCTDVNDDDLCCSGSLDQTSRIWNVRTAQLLCVLQHDSLVFNCFVSKHACLEDGKCHLVVTGSERGVRFFVADSTATELQLESFAGLKDFETLFGVPEPVLPQQQQLGFTLDTTTMEPGELKRAGNIVYGPVDNTFLVWVVAGE